MTTVRNLLLALLLAVAAFLMMNGIASAAIGCPTPKPGEVACLETPAPRPSFCHRAPEPRYNTRWGYDDPSLNRRG